MPFTITVDTGSRIIHVQGTGDTSLTEVLKTVERLVDEARKNPNCAILADNRELNYEPPVEDVVAISRALFEARNLLRRSMAVVVKRGMQEQLGRVFAAMGNYFGTKVDVFTDADDAMGWLRSTPETSM